MECDDPTGFRNFIGDDTDPWALFLDDPFMNSSSGVATTDTLHDVDVPIRRPRSKTFSDEAHQAINHWLKEHLLHPYMTRDQEASFTAAYNMTRVELRTTLNNRRQRFVKPIRDEQMAAFRAAANLARQGSPMPTLKKFQ
jgi:hypothetical protein